MILKVIFVLVFGTLAGHGAYYLLSLLALSKEERLYLRSFYNALVNGQYKKIEPEDKDHGEA